MVEQFGASIKSTFANGAFTACIEIQFNIIIIYSNCMLVAVRHRRPLGPLVHFRLYQSAISTRSDLLSFHHPQPPLHFGIGISRWLRCICWCNLFTQDPLTRPFQMHVHTCKSRNVHNWNIFRDSHRIYRIEIWKSCKRERYLERKIAPTTKPNRMRRKLSERTYFSLFYFSFHSFLVWNVMRCQFHNLFHSIYLQSKSINIIVVFLNINRCEMKH